MASKLSDGDRDNVVKLYLRNPSIKRVAEATGLERPMVQVILSRAKVPPLPGYKGKVWTPLPISFLNEVVRLHLTGLDQRQLAIKFGKDQKLIGCILRESGKGRSNADAQKLTWVNGRVSYQLRTDVDVSDIVARYLAGESITAIAASYSINRRGVAKRLVKAGVALRTADEAYALVDREKVATRAAVTKGKNRSMAGRFEDVLYDMLVDRGESPKLQFPVGTKNLDVAVKPVSVEVVLGTHNPLEDPYCSERIKYLADRGWQSLYVFISRRTELLLPAAADKVVSLLNLRRRHPAIYRKHWVVRGCGELAAVASFDLKHVTHIPPSKDCPHHSSINKRLRG